MIECKVKNAANKVRASMVDIMQSYFNFVLPPDGDPSDNRGRGIFGEILGMRHLQWEDLQRKRHNMEPINSELLDFSFIKGDN
jgi:hypothetical protein